jgi:hypothetical protein
MKVIRTHIPEQSILRRTYKNYHYADSLEGLFKDSGQQPGSSEIARTFSLSGPTWGHWLFKFRNKLVAPLGLKTWERKVAGYKNLSKIHLEIGDQLGIFTVFDKTSNEIILGEDDKHLNFRVSLFLERLASRPAEYKLTISTIVIFNSWAGVFYFFFIGPFHRLIVRVMLKKMLKRLESADSC